MVVNDKKVKKQIIDKLSLSVFTVLQQNIIVAGLINVISAKITMELLGQLTEDERKELMKISKLRKENDIIKYLNSKINNIPALAEKVGKETIENFTATRQITPRFA